MHWGIEELTAVGATLNRMRARASGPSLRDCIGADGWAPHETGSMRRAILDAVMATRR